jgi:protein TonB
MFSQIESGGLLARPLRRRLLPVFLAASFVLHAAVVVVVPRPALDYQPARARVLEVVLVQSEPPRSPPTEPQQVPLPPQPNRALGREPVRAAAVMDSPRQADVMRPVLAFSEPNVAGESAVAGSRPAEKRAPAVDAKTEVASVVPTLPSFSAAYLRNPAPRYPVAARRAGDQGTVTMRVLVTRDGLPARVDVEKSSGSPHLDAAALEAVKTWRFVPARQGPDAVESWVLVPIVFRLEGPS